MKIVLVTPAPPGSRSGNRATAMRWAELFAQLGEEVTIVTRYAGEDADAMVAIHAWRSADSIESFAAAHPGRPLIVLLAGTDLYRDLESHRDVVLRSLDLADLIVGLHDLVGEPLEPRHRAKLAVIYQSALPPTHAAPPLDDAFEVLVVGHLRAEKDPLRAAKAARLLPAVSRIKIEHLGRAHDAEWASRAEAEMAGNPRYRWRGEVGREEIGTRLGRARLMVLSSLMEGGANVISEALVAGLPVLASAIPGSIGLLGRDYAALFPAGDETALAALMMRAETEPGFLARLEAQCAVRAPRFAPGREREALAGALGRAMASKARNGA